MVAPVRPGQRGTPPWLSPLVEPGQGGGTPPWVPPIEPGWGPHLGYPPSDLGGGGGTLLGGTPPRVPPHQTWPVGPHLRYPPIGLGRGRGGGGYPTTGNRWRTSHAAVVMPLAFTQEDFLVVLFTTFSCCLWKPVYLY